MIKLHGDFSPAHRLRRVFRPCLHRTLRNNNHMTRINGWACFFLVLLRLAIGWHFFIEGLHKIHTHRIGKTTTNTPWTSEGFFRAGYGPLAPLAKSLLHIDAETPARPDENLAQNGIVATVDKVTMWSLTIGGGLLLVGFLSRPTCFLLALFLLSVTLIAPAMPGAPTPPGSTGHYLYVNLYTIEMVALLALAFLPTGRWFGVDALFVRLPRPTATAT
jgi:uncharacterized membrane protein YphA (DoxX/SURF4 family)